MDIRKRKRIVKLRRILKKIFSWIGSVLLALAVWGAIIFGVYKGGCRMYDHFKESYNFPVGEHLYCKVYKDGTNSLFLSSSNKKVGKRYKKVDADLYGDDLVHVMNKRDLEGLVSATTGTLMIPCKYEKIWCPDEKFNYAACYKENRAIEFINCNNGKKVFDFKSGAAINPWTKIRFKGNYCVIPMFGGKERLIDSTGQCVLKNCNIKLVKDKYLVENESNNDYTYSLYDAADLHCLLSDMDEIQITDVGILCLKGEEVCLMDSSATNIITDLVLDAMFGDEYEEDAIGAVSKMKDPNEGRQYSNKAVEYGTFYKDGLCGVFDEDYNLVIEPLWDYIEYLGNGYFLCYFAYEEYCIIMNKDGKIVRRSKNR